MTVRGQGFAHLHSVQEVQELIDNNLKNELDTEEIRTDQAIGRTLAENVISPKDLPGYRRAAMDGFAVHVTDTHGASETNPKQLKLIGEIEIGDQDVIRINKGEAVKISTGAPIPNDATGVVKIEDCEVFNTSIEIYSAIPMGKNIADKDEDVKKEELILNIGTLLQPWDIGMLLSCSIKSVKVYKKPKIATLSTGNELVSSENDPEIGQVVDSNRVSINGWLKQLNCEIVESLQCADNPEIIRENILSLAQDADLIITTGGTSVGSKDFLAEVISEVGELWVHGVTIRPGKPVALGKITTNNLETPIISLPGYPLAAFLNFHLFVSYTISKWTSHPGLLSRMGRVVLAEKVPSKVGTRDFVRLKATEQGAKIIRISGAGILSSLIKADYLLEVPDDLEGYNAGESVQVYILR